MSEPSQRSLPALTDFPDWQGPMVVKELRHGLRTRFFSVALIQFHLLLVLLMASLLFGADEEMVHGIFWTLALVLVLGVMPLRGFGALTAEVSSGTLDMLMLTNLSSLRIVLGKWTALFSQTLLVVSSLLPYMVARYYLGGVEILAEAAALALAVLTSSVVTAAIVAFSTQKAVLLRLLLLAGVLIPMIPLSIFIVSLITGNIDVLSDFTLLPGWQQAMLVGAPVLVAIYGTYLFLTLGASRFASPAENHSTTKRLVGLVVMSALGITGVLFGLARNSDSAILCMITSLMMVLILGMDVMTEEMPVVPTALRGRYSRSWWRLCGRLLYPGWASGVFYYALICLAPLTISAVETFQKRQPDMVSVVACILAANVVPALIPVLRQKPFQRWWVVQLVILAGGLLMAILGDVSDIEELGWLLVFTPPTALIGAEMVPYSENREALITGAVFGGLWFLAALIVAVGEMRTYRVLEREAATLDRESGTTIPTA